VKYPQYKKLLIDVLICLSLSEYWYFNDRRSFVTHGVVADGGARLILAWTLTSPKLHILGYHYMVIGL